MSKSDLNSEQIKAVKHDRGPCLVIAGPGSGKTTVITSRLKYLVCERMVKPENILVITFTKAAAIEMKDRYKRMVEGTSESYSASKITFGTFHAVFFNILRYAYNYSVDNIIKDEDRYELVRKAVIKQELDIDDEREFLMQVLGEISRVKSDGVDIGNYYSTTCPSEAFREIYADYVHSLKRNRLIDFDDMLLYCYELLNGRSDILSNWQKRFEYILVDEFQDINKVQYDTIRLLAKPQDNLFIVGDDDQSIYGFRGSKPEIMLGFKNDYRKAVEITLSVNYRSSKEIVERAGKLIACNSKRYKKKIEAKNGQMGEVLFFRSKDFIDEYSQVAESVRMLLQRPDYKYSDIAILYRSSAGIGSLVRKLMELNIPFRIKDSVPDIYDHFIAKDIFAYIRIAKGIGNRGDFIQIMNKPKRYIGRDYLTDFDINLDELCKYYEEKPWMVERIEKLQRDLSMLATLNPYAAVNYIRRAIGYDEYLAEYALSKHIAIEELMDVIGEIMDSARSYNTVEEWSEGIKNYRYILSQKNKDAGDKVTLTTMHSAKGLEYRTVYIIDANEGSCPHKKAVLDCDIEEERRMFYVAMTRAKESLYIYSTAEKFNKKTEVSRFVYEAELVET